MNREWVKQILDKTCWDDYWYECPTYHVEAKQSITHRRHKEEVQCWMCHQNDALVDKLTQEQGE